MSVNTSSLISSQVNKATSKMTKYTSKMDLVAPSSLTITSNHNLASLAGQLSAWLTGGNMDDLVVLSNGDPVTFAKGKSKKEADNLGAWINHLLGVKVEKADEVKVKEIMEDVLNKSFDLLEEAEEDESNDLLEELCPEEEEEDLVLADVEETVDFFEMEVRGLLKKHYPDDDSDFEMEVRSLLKKHYPHEDEEKISTSLDEPIENEKEISYVSFDPLPIGTEFSFDQEVSLEFDESEYLPGTLEITGEMPKMKDEEVKGIEEEKESTENEDHPKEIELTETEWFDLVSETTFDHESLDKPKEIELSEVEWFEVICETEHDSGSLQEAAKSEEEKENLRDEMEFEVEGGDIRKASRNMPAFVEDEIVGELNKVEWLQLVSKDLNEDEPLEEKSEDEQEEEEDAEMTEEEWFELVGETDGDLEKMSSIYEIEQQLLENFLAVDKFGLGDGEVEEEEEVEEEGEVEDKFEETVEETKKVEIPKVVVKEKEEVMEKENVEIPKVVVEEKVEESVEEPKKMDIPKEDKILETTTSERRDVSLQTDFDPSDDEEEEMLLENERDGDWNETIEQHVEEAIEAVVSKQTEEIPEAGKDSVEEPSPSRPIEPSVEVGATPTEENVTATEKVETSSEELKCPMCEKPPFGAPAELLKHLTSGHFAKQMADVYKTEVNQPCHLCVREGRDKLYTMTSMKSNYLTHVGVSHARVIEMLEEQPKRQLVSQLLGSKQSRWSSLLSNMGLAPQPRHLVNSKPTKAKSAKTSSNATVEEKPAEVEKPFEKKLIEEKSIEEKSIEEKSIEEKSIEEKSIEEKPVEEKLIGEKAIKEGNPVEKKLVEAAEVESVEKPSEVRPKKLKKPAQKKKPAQEVEKKEKETSPTEEKEKESYNVSLLASLPGLTFSLAPHRNEGDKKAEASTELPSQVTIQTSEAPKIAPKEAPKTAPKEAPKTAAKEAPKTAPKEAPKTAPKEAPKIAPKEALKGTESVIVTPKTAVKVTVKESEVPADSKGKPTMKKKSMKSLLSTVAKLTQKASENAPANNQTKEAVEKTPVEDKIADKKAVQEKSLPNKRAAEEKLNKKVSKAAKVLEKPTEATKPLEMKPVEPKPVEAAKSLEANPSPSSTRLHLVELEVGLGGLERSVQKKNIEVNPTEAKPVKVKPAKIKAVKKVPSAVEKPAEEKAEPAKAVEVKTAQKIVPTISKETKPVETNPIEAKPLEKKPIKAKSDETLPVPDQPAETKSEEVEPVQKKINKKQPAKKKIAETKAIETKAIETKAIETKAIETKAIETKAIETKAIETKAIETKASQIKAAKIKPVDSKPIAANPDEVKAIEAKPVVSKAEDAKSAVEAKSEAKPAAKKAATLKKSVAKTKAKEAKSVETKPDENAEEAEDVKGSHGKVKHSGVKSMKCLLCKEKPEMEKMEFTRTQMLGHLTNIHFSKELAKEFGDCAEGDECVFCVQDQKTPVFKMKRKHDYMRHLGMVHDKVVAYLPEEMQEALRKPTTSIKRKAEAEEAKRCVKTKI